MTEHDPPAPSIVQRAAAIRKAMTEVRKAHAERNVKDALNTRNGPSSTSIHQLPLNSDVLVWREGQTGYAGKWTGPYKLLSINREICISVLPIKPIPFRTIVVKPYRNLADKDSNNNVNKDV